MNNNAWLSSDLRVLLVMLVLVVLNSCPTLVLLGLGRGDAVLPLYMLEGGLVVLLFTLASINMLKVGSAALTVFLGLGVAFYWGGWPLGLCLFGSIVLALLLIGYFCGIVAKSFNKLP